MAQHFIYIETITTRIPNAGVARNEEIRLIYEKFLFDLGVKLVGTQEQRSKFNWFLKSFFINYFCGI